MDNIRIEILRTRDSARYLGQKVTFEDQETEEVKNRLKAAWAAFHKYRQELTSKGYRLCHRLRLFNMVITPTMTYASGTWTLTQKHEKMIKTAQRKMLRLIIQTKRKYKTKKKAPSRKERVFECQPGLDPTLRTKRSVGRPKRRWEDDLNEFTKTEEGHDKAQYEFRNNNSWMNEIKDYRKWKENEEWFSENSRVHFGVEE